MEKINKTWQADLKSKKKLTIDDAKFIFEQAEKFLIEIIDSHKTIIDRTNTLLALNITILTALVGFNVSKLENGYGQIILNSVWLVIVYLLIGVIYLAKNITPTAYYPIGSQPLSIFINNFFRDNVQDEKRIIAMYSSEIERYQTRITENIRINNSKWKIYRNGIYLLTGIPIIFLLSYLILDLIA